MAPRHERPGSDIKLDARGGTETSGWGAEGMSSDARVSSSVVTSSMMTRSPWRAPCPRSIRWQPKHVARRHRPLGRSSETRVVHGRGGRRGCPILSVRDVAGRVAPRTKLSDTLLPEFT